MKSWLLLPVPVIVLAVAAITNRYCIEPVMNFTDVKICKIKELANLIQMILWVITGIYLVIGFFLRNKKSKIKEKIAAQYIDDPAGYRSRYLERVRHHCLALTLAALGGEESADQELTLAKKLWWCF